MNTNTVDRIEKLQCEICDAVFKSKDSLRNHINGVHKNDTSCSYKCGICSKEYSSVGNLNIHTKNVHGGEKKSTKKLESSNGIKRAKDKRQCDM